MTKPLSPLLELSQVVRDALDEMGIKVPKRNDHNEYRYTGKSGLRVKVCGVQALTKAQFFMLRQSIVHHYGNRKVAIYDSRAVDNKTRPTKISPHNYYGLTVYLAHEKDTPLLPQTLAAEANYLNWFETDETMVAVTETTRKDAVDVFHKEILPQLEQQQQAKQRDDMKLLTDENMAVIEIYTNARDKVSKMRETLNYCIANKLYCSAVTNAMAGEINVTVAKWAAVGITI